jgi:hypothetical protein
LDTSTFASGVARLSWALLQRGAEIARIEYILSNSASERSYQLVIVFAKPSTSGQSELRVTCPLARSAGLESAPVRLPKASGGGPRYSIVPVPTRFVCASGGTDAVEDLFSGLAASSDIRSSCDLVGLLNWSLGYSSDDGKICARWPEYSQIPETGALSTIPYVDCILDCLADQVGHRISAYRDPTLLITGDTDAASESDIVSYITAVEDSGGAATLLVWSESQLTERIVGLLGEKHSIGIHPYALDGSFDSYADRCIALSRHVQELSGRPPSACRNHKFQWHEPNEARQVLADLGVRADLNLVAADGKCWLGIPTGVAQANAVLSISSGVHFWEIPTVIEDEVFLYDLDYCFHRSGDLRAMYPFAVITDFLDYWVLQAGRPACVNLHPEHVSGDYGKVLAAVLGWARANGVRMPSMTTYIAELEGRITPR